MTADCVEVDGCCVTHSPCFDTIGAALEGVEVPAVCQGWPCPHRPMTPPVALSWWAFGCGLALGVALTCAVWAVTG